MFVFGDPISTAQLYLSDLTVNNTGPRLAQSPVDEMSEQELRHALVWLRMGIIKARQEGLGQEVLEVLVEWYDEVFIALASTSSELLSLLKKGLHVPPLGVSDREKYLDLAKAASAS